MINNFIKKIRNKWHNDIINKIFISNYDISWNVSGKTWFAEFENYHNFISDINIQDYIKKLFSISYEPPYSIPIYCDICKNISISNSFILYGIEESYSCNNCGMNSRKRAMYEFVYNQYRNKKNIYIQEAVTTAYYIYEKLFNKNNIIGSEYLGEDKTCGKYYNYLNNNIMHQDCTNMSFSDNTFDLIISQHIFEHIFEVKQSLSELFRITKPNGAIVLSFPFFLFQEKNNILARRIKIENKNEFNIEYLHTPPKFHINPADPQGGSLVYWEHGWEFLDIMRDVGYTDVKLHLYNNVYKGYFGCQSLISAKKE